MTSVRITNELDEEAWRRFLEYHPHSNIFHTPDMFEVFARTRNHRPTLWAAIGGEGDVLALLLPVQITLFDGLPRRLTSRAVAYGSLLYKPGPSGEDALEALLRAYTQTIQGDVLFTELRNLCDLSPIQPLLNRCGFVMEDHLNYLVDLERPLEAVMQSVGSRTRKNIRRALRKEEVHVAEVTEPGGVQTCYRLLQTSYRAAGVPLVDQSMFDATFDVLYPRDMVRFWLATIEEIPVAASVELLFKDWIYGWYSGVDRSYSNYLPGEVLMWRVFEWGVEHGYRMYDFGGAGKPQEDYGVRDFKAKFGGKLVGFGRNTYVHAPARLAFSKAGYYLYHRLQVLRDTLTDR